MEVPHKILAYYCRMTEAPFRPREKLTEKQKYFQSIHRHTYLKGPFDKVTSVAIPLALAATATFMIVSLPPLITSSHGRVWHDCPH